MVDGHNEAGQKCCTAFSVSHLLHTALKFMLHFRLSLGGVRWQGLSGTVPGKIAATLERRIISGFQGTVSDNKNKN